MEQKPDQNAIKRAVEVEELERKRMWWFFQALPEREAEKKGSIWRRK